jgi:hypothetical protein
MNPPRYSYMRNNPLKYTDPSGYITSGGCRLNNSQFTSGFNNIESDRLAWNNYTDYLYHRGEFALGGGFAGTVTFMAVTGAAGNAGFHLYQIAENGTIVTTNPEASAHGQKVIYRNGKIGYYQQVSGFVGYMTNNGYTIGFTVSSVKCIWVPLGAAVPESKEQGTVMYDRYGGTTNVFYHNHSSGGSFAAPPMGIFVNERYKNDPKYTTQLIQHEHAHILVSKVKGIKYHYATVAPISLASTQVWGSNHQYTSVEMEANQFGAMYWGSDNWDFRKNPISAPSGRPTQNGFTTFYKLWLQFSFFGL